MARSMLYKRNALNNARNVLTKVLNKYLDFHKVFDKLNKNILLKHNEHSMAIEFEDGKILFISYIYDLSQIKLKVLREYIDKILTKSFIVSSKFFIRTFILFFKKKQKFTLLHKLLYY